MGKKDRGLKKAALQVNPVVVEFIEAAAVGDVKAVKKIAKSGKIEIDDGESGGVFLWCWCLCVGVDVADVSLSRLTRETDCGATRTCSLRTGDL